MLFKKISFICFIVIVMVHGQTHRAVLENSRQAPKLLNYHGTRYLNLATEYANTSGNYQSFGDSVTLKLVANDYVEVFLYSADATTTNSALMTYTNFSCHQLY